MYVLHSSKNALPLAETNGNLYVLLEVRGIGIKDVKNVTLATLLSLHTHYMYHIVCTVEHACNDHFGDRNFDRYIRLITTSVGH